MVLPAGFEFFTEPDNLPNCVDPHSLVTPRNTIDGLFGSKRSRLQPTIYSVNEQFSPNVHLPWTCTFETFWKDLGENHFPRFIQDGICNSGACWYGHYFCQSVVYKMEVIYRQFRERCLDRNLPNILASDWRLKEINITVACLCSRG